MKSRKKRIMARKKKTTAKNYRNVVHKYIPLDEQKSVAIQVGICSKCNKITECWCDSCSKWYCENHLDKKNEKCEKCEREPIKQSYFG